MEVVKRPKGFQPGVSGNPAGRPKYSKGKKNKMLDELLTKVVLQGKAKFIEELSKLEGKQYTDAYLTAYEFVRGKVARQELSTSDGQEIKLQQVFMIDGVEIKF